MRACKAIIPAAGLGTRFLPATKAMPKEMLTIVDKPSIQYVLEEAVDAGVSDFLLVTGRNKGALEDHFDKAYELEATLEARGDTEKLKVLREFDDVSLSYIRQGEPLGLGHAILQGRNHVMDQPFIVMLPDDIIENGGELLIEMLEQQERLNATIIALIEVSPEEVNKYGVVKFESTDVNGLVKIIDMVEKPNIGDAPSNLAVAGRYVIKPEVFELLANQPKGKGGEIQLTDALKTMSHTSVGGGVYGVVIKGKRYDTGDKMGYLNANLEFALTREDTKEDTIALIQRLAKEHNLF